LKDDAKTSAINAANDIFHENICPSAAILNPSSWLKSSICGLGVVLNQAAKSLMTFALAQLKQTLGYKDGY
jgi:hypothetical protein